jgi:hypothetical protein
MIAPAIFQNVQSTAACSVNITELRNSPSIENRYHDEDQEGIGGDAHRLRST